jgi:serine protease Do
MSRLRRLGFGSSAPRRGAALILFLLLLAGSLPAQSADRDAPPTLPITAYEPLPAVLRKTVPGTVDDLRAIEQRVRSLIEELQEVTVGIRRGPAQGTGVIVTEDGYVLTAAHVSGPPGRRVTLIRNDGTTLNGISLGRDERIDAGLVKITDPGPWPVAKVGDLDDLKTGDWVVGTGHPGGFDRHRLPVVRLGRLITKLPTVLHTDVTLVGGDSGGPLFDLNGRVVGIHSRIGPGAELNFHVPITAYTRGWHWMTRSEERPVRSGPGGPMLGVDGDDVRDGCRVTRVTADSPAERAGLRPGDVITRLEEHWILGLEDLIAAVNQFSPGDVVTVTFRREGEQRTTRVTLAERPRREERSENRERDRR